jgi:hypothetical protein
MIAALLVAAQVASSQAADRSLAQVAAARLTSEMIRSNPTPSIAGLDQPLSIVVSPDKGRTARVRLLSKGSESRRARIEITRKGQPTKTLATVVNPFGLAWSPDGTKIAFSEGAVVTIADSNGATRQVIHTGPGGRYPGACFDLLWSTDGRTLSFTQVENADQLDLSRPMRVSITLGVRAQDP